MTVEKTNLCSLKMVNEAIGESDDFEHAVKILMAKVAAVGPNNSITEDEARDLLLLHTATLVAEDDHEQERRRGNAPLN